MVDALNEKALSPVDHLTAQANLQRQLASIHLGVHIGIKQRGPRELTEAIEACITEWRVLLVAGRTAALFYVALGQRMVIPSARTSVETTFTLIYRELRTEPDEGREGFAFLVIQVS